MSVNRQQPMGLVRLNGPNFWDMQEVPCDKEELMATRWSFFGEKWKTTMEVPGIASMVLLRGTGDLLEISQSGKGTLKMKFSAFTHHSLQKFGYQLYKLFFSLLCEIIKLWKFDITYWINSSSKVNVMREKHQIISILRSLLFRIGTKSSLSSILHFLSKEPHLRAITSSLWHGTSFISHKFRLSSTTKPSVFSDAPSLN